MHLGEKAVSHPFQSMDEIVDVPYLLFAKPFGKADGASPTVRRRANDLQDCTTLNNRTQHSLTREFHT